MIGVKEPQIVESRRLVAFMETHSERVFTGGLAFDVGAHAGSWTVRMSQFFQFVIALEPDPCNFHNLQLNTMWIPNVAAIQRAAWCRTTPDLEVCSPKRRTSTARQVRPKANGGTTGVRLDDYASKRVGLLKLDCEGSEIRALSGAGTILANHRPAVLIEHAGIGKDDECRDLLLRYGYKPVWRDGVDWGYIAA